MLVAAVQLNSSADVGRNVEVATRLIRDAAGAGAELICLPEKWNALAAGDELVARAESLEEGPSTAACRELARELGVFIVAGSIAERVEGSERLYNTSALIDADGEIAAVYRKIHLFDVDVGGVSYRESDLEAPGRGDRQRAGGRGRARPDGLLRPALPGAVPNPRRGRGARW